MKALIRQYDNIIRPIRITKLRFLQATLAFFMIGFFFFPTSKSHNNFYYALVLVPFLFTITYADIKTLLGSTIIRFFLFYIGFLYASLFWGHDTPASDYLKYMFRCIYMIGFMGLCAMFFRDKCYEKNIISALIIVATTTAIISIIKFYQINPLPQQRLFNIGNLDHEILGTSAYGIVAIFCYNRLFSSCKFHKFGYGISFIVLTLDIFLTRSRGPLLAFVVALIACELLRKRFALIILGGSLMLIYALLCLQGIVQPASFLTRAGGDSYRFEIWKAVISLSSNAPWFGYGFNTEQPIIGESGIVFSHAHNVFVATLLYGGIISLIVLICLIIMSAFQGIQSFLIDRDPVYLGCLVFGLVCTLTDSDKLLTHPKPLWLFFWLPLALLASNELKRKQNLLGNKDP